MGQGGGADQLVAPPAVDVALLGTGGVVRDGRDVTPTGMAARPTRTRSRSITAEGPPLRGRAPHPSWWAPAPPSRMVVEQIALRSHRVFAGALTAPVIPHEQHSPVAYVPLRPSTAAAAPGTSDHAMRGD